MIESSHQAWWIITQVFGESFSYVHKQNRYIKKKYKHDSFTREKEIAETFCIIITQLLFPVIWCEEQQTKPCNTRTNKAQHRTQSRYVRHGMLVVNILKQIHAEKKKEKLKHELFPSTRNFYWLKKHILDLFSFSKLGLSVVHVVPKQV